MGAQIVEVGAPCGYEDKVLGFATQPEADVAAGTGDEAGFDQSEAGIPEGFLMRLPAFNSHGEGVTAGAVRVWEIQSF